MLSVHEMGGPTVTAWSLRLETEVDQMLQQSMVLQRRDAVIVFDLTPMRTVKLRTIPTIRYGCHKP